MSNQLRINKVSRVSTDGAIETLELQPGVNILAGPPNSGKTVWLNIIDYLMGDTGTIEEVLANEDAAGQKLYEKYVSASMDLTVGDKEITVERRWTELGARGKIYINEEAILDKSFSDYLLGELEIPILHFPKGNPYTDRAWPELSWRMMLRHIYRRENFWSDIADKQPDVEQHAVLAQFLGIAEKMFSQQFGDIISKRKQLLRLEAEKEQFGSILDNIGKSMADPNENITFLTHESINQAIANLEVKIKELLEKRQEILSIEISKIEQENKETESFILQKTTQRESLISRINEVNTKQKELIKRSTEFRGIRHSIHSEIEKLKRTKEAGTLFADLKITHCPACDQAIKQNTQTNDDHCFLCHQPTSTEQAHSRLDFEIAQLSAEEDEIAELISSLVNEEEGLNTIENNFRHDLVKVDRELAPLRNKLTGLVSPEVGHIDTERGRLEEQIEGHKRMLKNLDYKSELVKKIDTLTGEISKLEGQVDSQEEEINYEEVSSNFEDQMANYFNALNKDNSKRWPHKRPTVRVGEKDFVIKVNEAKWSKAVGATSKLYFLFAYHYGLLALTNNESCHYPGLLIIDFPPELPNTELILFTENYVVEPFIDLCKKSEKSMQVIIAGNSFKDLENVNLIPVKFD